MISQKKKGLSTEVETEKALRGRHISTISFHNTPYTHTHIHILPPATTIDDGQASERHFCSTKDLIAEPFWEDPVRAFRFPLSVGATSDFWL